MEHVYKPNCELEMRIGFLSESGFHSEISEKTFYALKNVLDSFAHWESHNQTTFTDMYYTDCRKRGDVCVKKNTLYKTILKSTLPKNMCIRLSIADEHPTKPKGKILYKLNKHRYSYVYSFYRYDLTHNKTNHSFHVELEAYDIDYVRSHDFSTLTQCMQKEIVNLLRAANI